VLVPNLVSHCSLHEHAHTLTLLRPLPPISRLPLCAQDCQGMQSCYQVCKQTCPTQQVVVNGEACKSYGTWVAGPAEAQKACDLTMVSCQ
jgi:hypothetical protein